MAILVNYIDNKREVVILLNTTVVHIRNGWLHLLKPSSSEITLAFRPWCNIICHTSPFKHVYVAFHRLAKGLAFLLMSVLLITVLCCNALSNWVVFSFRLPLSLGLLVWRRIWPVSMGHPQEQLEAYYLCQVQQVSLKWKRWLISFVKKSLRAWLLGKA